MKHEMLHEMFVLMMNSRSNGSGIESELPTS